MEIVKTDKTTKNLGARRLKTILFLFTIQNVGEFNIDGSSKALYHLTGECREAILLIRRSYKC